VVGVSVAERRFLSELTSLLDKKVSIKTTDGRKITGRLVGYHPGTLSVCLWDAEVEEEGITIPKLFLNGAMIVEISSAEKPFDIRGLANRIAAVFGEEHVKLIEDKGIILVMGRIRVTEEGVEGPPGPATDRVRGIFNKFVEEMTSKS